jgi:hypothetical protein
MGVVQWLVRRPSHSLVGGARPVHGFAGRLPARVCRPVIFRNRQPYGAAGCRRKAQRSLQRRVGRAAHAVRFRRSGRGSLWRMKRPSVESLVGSWMTIRAGCGATAIDARRSVARSASRPRVWSIASDLTFVRPVFREILSAKPRAAALDFEQSPDHEHDLGGLLMVNRRRLLCAAMTVASM